MLCYVMQSTKSYQVHKFSLICWNHIKRDVRFHLRNKYPGIGGDEISVYVQHTEDLLCESENVFQNLYFQQYYHIELLICRANIGKYSLKEDFAYCDIDSDSIPQIKTVSPEEIVDYVKSSDKYEPTKPNDIAGDVIETVPIVY